MAKKRFTVWNVHALIVEAGSAEEAVDAYVERAIDGDFSMEDHDISAEPYPRPGLLARLYARLVRCRTCGGDGTDDAHFYGHCPRGAVR